MTPISESESLRFALLDLQIVDSEGLPVGRVDDVVFSLPDDGGPPVVSSLLTGAEALGGRIGGPLTRTMASVAARLRSRAWPCGPVRLAMSLVADHGNLVQLRVPLRELPQVAGLEHWLARQVVGPVPGAQDPDD